MKIAVKVNKSDMARLREKFSHKSFERAATAAMKETVESGANGMRERITTSGTHKTWASPWFGRAGSGIGRVDTARMLNDVSAGAVGTRGGKVLGSFGWVKNSRSYYAHQEYGFRHALSGEYIEGMESMHAGIMVARETALRALAENIRREMF